MNSQHPRDKVLQEFAAAMAERLSKNCCFDNEYDKKGNLITLLPGWLKDNCSFDSLLSKMAEHCGQINDLMRLAINGNSKEKIIVCDEDVDELIKQCADCANFAMMIADRAKRRKKTYREDIDGFAVD